MAFQESVAMRNAVLTAKTNTVQPATVAGTLKIFSGAEPANCAAADPSGLLGTATLSSPPWNTPSAGSMTINGTWSGTASATGTIASWRIYDPLSVCHMQGNTTDMAFDNTSITNGQAFTVTQFTVTAGNA